MSKKLGQPPHGVLIAPEEKLVAASLEVGEVGVAKHEFRAFHDARR